jgi:mono/diheme cytochrome c family protein
MTPFRVLALFALLLLIASLDGGTPARAADQAAIARGAYLAAAGDCAGCHTDKKNGGADLAGGKPLVTAFGTFFGPNITPDPETGIGTWTEDQFQRALREGIDEHGQYLYPVFPFTSFTNISDADVSDLFAYLQSVPPINHPTPSNAVKVPFGWRPLLFFWRALYFTPGPLQPVPAPNNTPSDEWNRGRYLAEAVGHCQECHTPRNFLGGLDRSRAYAGNPRGPDDNDAPDITSDKKDGLGDWKIDDIADVLKSGMTPDGDSVGGGMTDVVDGTGKLTDADRHAIAVYIQSLPALPKTLK